MSRRCSDHLPQHSCSQTLLEQSWTALGTNSCSLHTYISHDLHGLPVSQSRWTSRGWILPEKFLKVWHVPPKRGASPHKNLPADKVLWKSLLLHCFPRPHFHSWTRYLQKGPHHCFSFTPDRPNPLITVLVRSRAIQLRNDTPTYWTSRVQDLYLLLERCKEMWEVCYLLSCAITVFQVLKTEEGWTCG